MEARCLKAQELADRGRVVRDGDSWLVFSLNSGERYRVHLVPPSCTCPDFELRQDDCKHLTAVRIICSRAGSRNVPTELILTPPVQWPRKTYRQPDWAAYTAAQVNEKDEFLPLLADLCSGIEEPERQGRGRRSLPLCDQIYAACLKVYVGMSGRRAASDLRLAHERGFLSEVPHHTSIARYLESDELTPILNGLIVRSALPFKAIETEFAVDSSGFSASRFDRWYEQKWGRMRSEQMWVKAHAVVGTTTHVITAAEVAEEDSADYSQLAGLVKTTATGFKIGQVSADKAYSGVSTHEAIAATGGVPYIAFKKNATGEAGGLFGRMYHEFALKKEEFLRRYHRRSNIESAFSAVKRVFGDSVRSKTDTAMRNEVLAKLVCHNVAQTIHGMYELGIDGNFATEQPSVAKMILKFPM